MQEVQPVNLDRLLGLALPDTSAGPSLRLGGGPGLLHHRRGLAARTWQLATQLLWLTSSALG
jgi:hypothetical protein